MKLEAWLQKQSRAITSSSDSSMADKKKRRQVSVATFKRWQNEYEKEYQSLSWLHCMTDEHDPSLVNTSTCAVCTRFEANIRGLKNFLVLGYLDLTTIERVTSLDHAKSAQHKTSMMRLCAD